MTAAEIKKILQHKYATGGSTAIAFEVAHGTGRHANRHVDAVVMDIWPSRGLTLHAMEIKVSISDLKRELADGQKSEEIAQHCDLFSIVSPLGMIKPTSIQLPAAWGLIEVRADGGLKFTKEAKMTKARPVDRLFMAAMLRAVSKRDARAEVNELLAEERANIEKRVQTGVEAELTYRSADGARWKALEKALKDVPGNHGLYYSDQELMRAVALVLRSKLVNNYEGIRKVADLLGSSHENFVNVMKELGI